MGLASVAGKVTEMKQWAWKAYAKWCSTHASAATPAATIQGYANTMYAQIDTAFSYFVNTLPEASQYDDSLVVLNEIDHVITGKRVSGTIVSLNELSLDWRGEGNTNFQQNLLDPLAGINSRHSKMVLALHTAYRLARDIVATGEKDACKLADQAIETFKAQAEAKDGISASDAKVIIDMIGLAAGIGAAVATGGTSLALVAVAGTASFASNRIEGKDKELAIKGDYALDVAESVAAEAHRITSSIDDASANLTRLIQADMATIDKFSDDYLPIRPNIAGPV